MATKRRASSPLGKPHPTKKLKTNTSSIKKHTCGTCNKRFTVLSALRTHERTHTGEKPYTCTTCNKRFSQSSNLRVHKRTHTGEKPFGCDECDQKFSQASHLHTHERTHTGEKPFVCGACDKRFSHASTLHEHERTHTGEKPFECDECDKRFSHANNLRKHERTHTGEKPYTCTACDKRFSLASTLRRHERTHTGEKPFACTTCNNRFTCLSNLRKHERTHTGEKPYVCNQPGCSYKASWKQSLLKHLKMRHDIGKLPCTFCANEVAILECYEDQWGRHKICRPCHMRMTGRKTRVEKACLDHLAKHYAPQPTTQDQKMQGELCMNYRPDSVYESAFRTLVLEVDENQHKYGKPYKCDERRMGDIAAEIPGVPCVFVRWNPDQYKYNRDNAMLDGKIVDHALYKKRPHSLTKRLNFLTTHLEKIDAAFAAWDGLDVATLPEWVRPDQANLVVHYLYYDRDTDSCARSDGINIRFYQP